MFPPVEALRKDYIGIFTWLAAGYDPGSYPGKITFFWASEEPAMVGWNKVAGATEVESHSVPGTLMESVTKHISIVAGHVRVCLSKAQMTVLSKQGN